MRSDLALAALASAAVPGMKPVAVAGLALPLDEQPDHQRAVVEDATGRRWVIRSPLTPVAGARLLRNDELVRQLSRHLPFKVPSPVGRAQVGQDGYAVVYPHVEGLPLDFTRLPPGPGLASAIGRAVAAVHNIPREVFEAQDVPVFDAPGTRQRLTAIVDRAAETGRVPTGLLARWEEAFDAAPLWQFATTPVHGAFRGGAVLVVFADDDASSGRVVAVTDWEEAMVSDPALDLADLYARTAPATWESVLDSYVLARAQRPDPYLHARARLLSETNRLSGLSQAVADDDEDRVRQIVESLRRMDRLTEDEDSLVPVTARGVGASVPFGTSAVEDHRERHREDDSEHHNVAEERSAGGDHGGGAGATAATQVISSIPGPTDDADVTAEVPVPSWEDVQPTSPSDSDDGEGRDVGGLGERRDLGEAGDGGESGVQDGEAQTDDLHTDQGADDAAPEGEPGEAEGAEDQRRGAEDEGEAPDVEELDDEERLHELYGMPAPSRDDG
ncbi:phosphotransferase [Ornithinimicrobium sufpigmenti]|uniref:phosphotransferase n=1 Tax=Ornithinimicrobium sufpigmenti TaxID=2508882 RepID=UPI001EE0CADE|nr:MULTISPECIES: phosphotransferase [unclassified Ornithinimicrobium]